MPNITQNRTDNIIAVILSGGAGSRFKGQDKGLHPYSGKALIEHVITAIKPQVSSILLCINRNSEQYDHFGYQTVVDSSNTGNSKSNSYHGPLAGIVSALSALENNQEYKYLLISSCDSPNLPNDYVAKLLSELQNKNIGSAVVNDGERNQNLHCLIHRKDWHSLTEFYAVGERAMHRWHKKNGSIEVDFSDQAACFSNINSPMQTN